MLFQGRNMKITNGRTRVWVDGNLNGGLLMLDTLEAWWIRCSIVLSSWGRMSTDETWRLFRTCASTSDGSWPANKRWCVTCRSGLWGSTTMFRPFLDLLRRLGLLTQQRWLLPSWSLLSMSLVSRRGVRIPDDEEWKHSDGYIKWFYRVCYHLIVSLAPVPEYIAPKPVYRRLLLSRSGPDILPIHCKSSAAWEPEWSMRWRFQRWLQIHSFSAFWRASGPIIQCLTRCRFHGGVGVRGSSNNKVLFYDFFIFVVFFMTFCRIWMWYIYICAFAVIFDNLVNFR